MRTASSSGSRRKLRGPMAGSTLLPASVIRPSFSSLRTLSLFSSDQTPPFLLGENLWARTPPMTAWVLSIHPKQRASSTASMYQNAPSPSGLPLLTATQHSSAVAWFSWSHALNWSLSVTSSMQGPLCTWSSAIVSILPTAGDSLSDSIIHCFRVMGGVTSHKPRNPRSLFGSLEYIHNPCEAAVLSKP